MLKRNPGNSFKRSWKH